MHRPKRDQPQPSAAQHPALAEPFELPVLDFPRLELAAVVTDRAVYRSQEQVRVFIAAPGAASQEVGLEVRLDNRQAMHDL